MGIRQLTKFIKEHVPDGYMDISIENECREFERVHGRKPEIVIDILGFLSLITNFDPDENEVDEDLAKLESLCGGRFPKYQKTCEILFKNLSEVADLVFFEDGTVKNAKLDTYIGRRNKDYEEMIEIVDMIYNRMRITEIINIVRDFPTSTTHIKIIEETASKYGKYLISITRECDAEIVKYANKNKCFAVLAEDSDFLIFEGDWRYFSLHALNIADLKTKEFNKQALWSTLGLTNSYQMSLLATINGNDFTSFDDLRNFHMWLTSGRNSAQNRFPAIARYIKDELSNQEPSRVIEIIASNFKYDRRQNAREKVSNSIEMYQTNFPLYIPTDPVERFCCQPYYNFMYSMLSNDIMKFSLLFFDLRSDDFPNLHEAEMELYTKQAGIILMHKNEENMKQRKPNLRFEFIAKVTHENPYEFFNDEPNYPEFDLPPLIELLSREEFENHERIRWILLRWTTDVGEGIKNIPIEFLHDIITLNFMCRRGFIEVFEADLILLAIKMARDGNYDEALDQIPEFLIKRAFHVSILFTKFHQSISKCFRVCGLRKFMKLIDFDGVIFHNLHSTYPTSSENPTVIAMLGGCVPYRLYA